VSRKPVGRVGGKIAMMTDPIADLLVRLKNASNAKHEKVDIPASRLKEEILKILKREGFIRNYKYIDDRRQGILRVYLRYGPNKEPLLLGTKRVSKPGCRVYVDKNRIPRVYGGYGIAIISTSQGVLTDKECRERKIGGEVLCYVW